jgi:hypothetical protein
MAIARQCPAEFLESRATYNAFLNFGLEFSVREACQHKSLRLKGGS